ncbi:VanZ family protein [Shuttleworthella satelles]|uniref:VanZ-like protein n=1 Tax=Shuttleworthella satelles DSM 14600 TaxID=626523 RepID=C4G9A4_9FIRM|nr:VanZ family protein [Shuttleworthia satelles]EEP29201.1 VanZ-like protein [Shuttleworthia satelles DSM 14600]
MNGIYFRNWTEKRWTGNFTVSWWTMIIDITKELFVLIFILGLLPSCFLKKRLQLQTRFWVILSFLVYVICLAKITLFPVYFFRDEDLRQMKEGVDSYFAFYQLMPLASIRNYLHEGALVQLIGNFLLLSPLSVYTEIFTRRKWKTGKKIALLAFVSVMIEALQLLLNVVSGFPARTADIDDFFLNTSGAVLTLVILVLFRKMLRNHEHFKEALDSLFYD